MKFFLILALLLTNAAASAQDTSFSATYDVYWKGFRVFSSDIKSEIKGEHYHAAASFYPRGMAKIFVNGRSDVSSKGLINERGAITAREYKVNGKWGGDISERHILFDENGRVQSVQLNLPEDWSEYPLQPIPDEFNRGPDPMSMLVAVLRDPWQKHGFGPLDELTPYDIDVIDGRGVMKYSMKCQAESTDLKIRKSRSPYGGETIECSIAFKQMAGFIDESQLEGKKLKKYLKRKKKAEKAKAKREARLKKGKKVEKDEILIWFQKFDDMNIYLPIRAEAKGSRGNAKIYLAKMEEITETITAR
ncbi:DUF3108 domain-containing protein [Temperatibacter marinus]|uniref:DUF3108 domain-containing protein n=1 Tax=Temperatibacter marinus TaxID=1456591 RepID=A0AA52EAW8_9PROT|nr:DUF3108 domain-containing protein [Temperatibacter marinus]WND01471.1 DUF3108 domain-containing protein [Temperatibacter marinus]